ncbi:MAG: TetM/TetW/TetO/TetS family tetracycline resistance ribosomal protection protein [Lachnospiraceae bacterium]|nr:TetM/TetW/TetO/TetS family tetracycline resistance ribosomal protection protein [Lachnospiraceae bacterium]
MTGILAHVDAGKTTLSEALLYEAGILKKKGRVDTKDSFLDNNAWERERGITIFSKVARLNLGELELILTDTPGHVDFSGEMERALNICDQAILIINASDGVQAHTKTVWKLLRLRHIPTFIFVNKTDLPGFDKERILTNLKKELSPEATDFSDLHTEHFYEEVATASEALLESYMDRGSLTDEEIRAVIAESKVFPVFFGSALKGDGVSEFLKALEIYSTVPATTEAFGAVCLKITKDKSGNRLTQLKLTGGRLKVKDSLNDEKVNEIRLYSGEKYEAVPEAQATDIVAVTGLKNSRPGMVYGAAEPSKQAVIEPVLTYAVKYPDDVDRTTMHRILTELEEEEPNLKVEYSEATREIYVHLMGEVQTEILTREIEERYNIKVSFGIGNILYKETIGNTVEGVGHFEPLRHYAEVHLKMEPLDRGAGLQFESDVSTDDLALNWQRLILTHLGEREHRGVLTGSPITDIKITLVAGRAHLKHTEGGDFRQATYRAVRQGLMMAESTLLEPFYFYELTVPENAVGRAMTDIDRMWGTAEISEQHDGISVINGKAPVSTLNGYAKEVAAYTKGLGTLSVSLAGYEPCHNALEVIEKRAYSPENDLRNTPDSVFCSHGAGTVIPWNEVYNYMHLPLMGEDKGDGIDIPAGPSKSRERAEIFVTTEEIDEIINKTAYANRSGRQGSFKGISESMREKRRIGGKPVNPPATSRKAAPPKEKYMLIDGYNVVHAWDELNSIASRDLNGAAGRLMDIVSNYSGITGIKTILVFDAYKVPGHSTEEIKYHNITVVYTKTAETADRYIERYAHENGKNYDIVVVTSDGVEQVIIRGAGCTLMSSRDFYEDCARKNDDMKNMKLPDSVRITE